MKNLIAIGVIIFATQAQAGGLAPPIASAKRQPPVCTWLDRQFHRLDCVDDTGEVVSRETPDPDYCPPEKGDHGGKGGHGGRGDHGGKGGHGNNGWGNGDQDAPGRSGDRNNAENGHGGKGKH